MEEKQEILQKQEESAYKRYVESFDKEFETSVLKRKKETPVFYKIFNEFLDNYKPTEFLTKTSEIKEYVKKEKLKTFTQEQIKILEDLDFYSQIINDDRVQQALIYGYLIGSELKRESIKQYPNK